MQRKRKEEEKKWKGEKEWKRRKEGEWEEEEAATGIVINAVYSNDGCFLREIKLWVLIPLAASNTLPASDIVVLNHSQPML